MKGNQMQTAERKKIVAEYVAARKDAIEAARQALNRLIDMPDPGKDFQPHYGHVFNARRAEAMLADVATFLDNK